MKPKVYIDGQAGTTGLEIYERLGGREDITLLTIDDALRKDAGERKRLMNSADLVFLCLPDDAAREAAALIDNPGTRVIDASTAHRTDPAWDYGFPELSAAHRAKIAQSRRVANPGCHATGALASVYPLVAMGILPRDYALTCFSLTGYSGGGKQMIADYETGKTPAMHAPRLYGLNLRHKHYPEIMAVSGLQTPIIFCPVVDDYYRGMATTITLHNASLCGGQTAERVRGALSDYYAAARFVTVAPKLGEGTLESNWGAGTNALELTVSGNDTLTMITARFDNLGKGASGAAVQNMNIMLGFDEAKGLL